MTPKTRDDEKGINSVGGGEEISKGKIWNL